MSASRTCQVCGAEIAVDVPSGHCANCLIQLGLAGASSAEAGTVAPELNLPPFPNPHPAPRPRGHPLPSDPSCAQSSAEASGRGQGQRFGDYELLGEIAQGGMGVVYKARQLSLNRTVAVKMIRSGIFASKEFVHRFRVEASAAAVLQHPNIVAVHEVGVHEGQHFFSMDYVAGKNLAQLAADGPLPANRAARYVQKIAEAIHYAHESGILHRDLKPSNVLVDQNDQPRITDFGLAKQLNSESSATLTGDIMGTPGYMPPEQASGNRGAVKAWSDVYSIGAILYHLLTGRAPFAAASLEATLNQMLHQDPIALRLLNPTVPRDLETICLKCLEKEPTKRYESAQLAADELTRFLNKEPILARPMSSVGKGWRWCRRKPALAAALALVGVVAVGSPMAALRINRERQRAERSAMAEGLQRQHAQASVTKLEIMAAEHLFEQDKAAEALGYLARVLRREPTNRVASERILSALVDRSFCLPLARLQHQGEVTAAQFSPDGQRVLTASRDKRARLWDGRSGVLLTELKHSNELLTAQFSPDGKQVVTASGDQQARVWDLGTAQLLRELPHPGPVLSAAFSTDGRRIVTGGQDQSVRVWDATTAEVRAGPFRLGGPVNAVQLSPDGTRLAAMSLRSHSAWVIEAESGTEVAAFPNSVYEMGGSTCVPQFNWEWDQVFAGNNLTPTFWAPIWALRPNPTLLARVKHPMIIHSVALSADGRTAATASMDNTAQLWDARSGDRLAGPLRHQDWVNAVDFSPDGRQLATGSKDNTARLWDVTTGQATSEPLPHQSALHSVQFSSDARYLLSVCADASVWVWSLRSRRALAQVFQHPSNVRRAVFSPDGARVATAENQGGGVRVWSIHGARPLVTSLRTSGGLQPQDLQFSPKGRWVAVTCGGVANAPGFTKIWDTSSANPRGITLDDDIGVAVESVRFHPTEDYVVAAGGNTNAIVWEVSTARVVSRLPHRSASHFARFSPDGQSVLTASYDGTAQVWNWRSGEARFSPPLRHDDRVVCADFSPDGRWIATLSRDKTARIWDAHTGRLRVAPLRHAEEPYHYNSIQFSPSGRGLVTAAGSAAQVWDAQTGLPLAAVLKHQMRVNSVRFSPDSQRVVTACTDGAARIWDVGSGHLLGVYSHQARVTYAEFSPDGCWLVTASEDATARVWELPQVRRSVAGWLAELADAIAGQRLLERDVNEIVPFERLAIVREKLRTVSAPGEPTQWAQWFLDETTAPSISPSSAITVPEYVGRRIGDATFAAFQEALQLSPANPLAQARLAFAELTNAATNPRQMVQSDWRSLLASRLAPGDPEVSWARAQVCERLGRFNEALQIMERGSSLHPENPAFWHDWGRLLEKTNRVDEALQAYAKAVELSGPWQEGETLPAVAWRNRSDLLKRLGRWAEAADANLKALNLSERQAQTPPQLVDLSLHYNRGLELIRRGANLTLMPVGRVPLAGFEFDIRGAVVLSSGVAEFDVDTPRVRAMAIQQKCRRLYFLHGAGAIGVAPQDGVAIGVYRLRYVDGLEVLMPIIYGTHLRAVLLAFDRKDSLGGDTKVGWAGATPDKAAIRVFVTAWDNPHPQLTIKSLDFVSSENRVIPFLLAITAEP